MFARPPTRTWRGILLLNVVAFASYAVVGALTLLIGQYSGLASPVWPAAGIAFALVYAWGWRVLPGIALGSVVSNAVTLARLDEVTVGTFAVTVVVGLGAALGAAVGAALVTTAVGPRVSLTRGGQIVAFLGLAGVVATMLNASIATAAQVAAGTASADTAMTLWLTWWVGDSIGVLVFAPITLMLIPDQAVVWRGRRWRVAIPGLVIVALFAGFFVQSELREQKDVQLRVEQLANSAAADLQRNVARHQEVLEGLSSYFEASEEVTAEEFTQYTESALRRFPNLAALSWNPIVDGADLAAFEAQQRRQPGLEDFTVTERTADGELIPVSPRDYYVTVGYIDPLETNRAALGFDINSNDLRQRAINTALELGLPSATAPIDLVQEDGSQKGMLALVPIFDPAGAAEDAGRPIGFAVGVYRLGDLLADTFAGPRWADVDLNLVDVTTPTDPQEIADRSAIRPPTVDLAPGAEPVARSDRFSVFGRTWQLEVTPTSGPLAERSIAANPSVEIVGLLVVFLLMAFVLLVTGLERQAVRQAERSEVEANTDHLTGLDNRRSFVAHLERVRERSQSQGSVDVLMFLDLDRFKAVNDVGGHEAGDLMLRSVARALRDSVRSRDIVARVGGDEFAIVLNDCEAERAVQIGASLVSAVEAIRVPDHGQDLSVGVSIGIVEIRHGDGLGIDELIRRADDACYEAKHSGGGARLYREDNAAQA